MHGKHVLKAGLLVGCRPWVDDPDLQEPGYYPEFLLPEFAHTSAKEDRQRGDRSHAILLSVEMPPAAELMAFADQLTEQRHGKHKMIRLTARAEIDLAENQPPGQQRKEPSPGYSPNWYVITRQRGEESGRMLFVTDESRERAAEWLADNPQPEESETLVVGTQPWPFGARYDEITEVERLPEPVFARLLEVAKQGKHAEPSSAERRIRNIVLSVLDNAEAIDADVSYAIDILTSSVQYEPAREAIREAVL